MFGGFFGSKKKESAPMFDQANYGVQRSMAFAPSQAQPQMNLFSMDSAPQAFSRNRMAPQAELFHARNEEAEEEG